MAARHPSIHPTIQPSPLIVNQGCCGIYGLFAPARARRRIRAFCISGLLGGPHLIALSDVVEERQGVGGHGWRRVGHGGGRVFAERLVLLAPERVADGGGEAVGPLTPPPGLVCLAHEVEHTGAIRERALDEAREWP